MINSEKYFLFNYFLPECFLIKFDLVRDITKRQVSIGSKSRDAVPNGWIFVILPFQALITTSK
jgi:hypothetical protein